MTRDTSLRVPGMRVIKPSVARVAAVSSVYSLASATRYRGVEERAKAGCVPPSTHGVFARAVRLALPPVLREPRDGKPAPPAEPVCSPSCRTSVWFLADMWGHVAIVTQGSYPFRSISSGTSVGG